MVLDVETAICEEPGRENIIPELSVGNNIREIRAKRRFSLRQLAEDSGLNINTLSLIENGRTSPSVSTLQCLARALYVPITSFFEPEAVKKQIVFTRHDNRTATVINKALMQNLAKDYSGNSIQPLIVTLEPGMGSGSQAIVHSGHEFVCCLSGCVQYQVGQEAFTLEQNDSLIFPAQLPHNWNNRGEMTAKVLLILLQNEHETPVAQHFQ